MELNNKHKQLYERTEIDEKIVTIENIDFDQLEQIKKGLHELQKDCQDFYCRWRRCICSYSIHTPGLIE
jgi:hypothetical protein